MVADFQVKVGRPAFDGAAQQVVNIHGHGEISPFRKLQAKLACGIGGSNNARQAVSKRATCTVGRVAQIDSRDSGV
jgi:hypothetical protein